VIEMGMADDDPIRTFYRISRNTSRDSTRDTINVGIEKNDKVADRESKRRTAEPV
jgi:hypothetical protein